MIHSSVHLAAGLKESAQEEEREATTKLPEDTGNDLGETVVGEYRTEAYSVTVAYMLARNRGEDDTYFFGADWGGYSCGRWTSFP